MQHVSAFTEVIPVCFVFKFSSYMSFVVKESSPNGWQHSRLFDCRSLFAYFHKIDDGVPSVGKAVNWDIDSCTVNVVFRESKTGVSAILAPGTLMQPRFAVILILTTRSSVCLTLLCAYVSAALLKNIFNFADFCRYFCTVCACYLLQRISANYYVCVCKSVLTR